MCAAPYDQVRLELRFAQTGYDHRVLRAVLVGVGASQQIGAQNDGDADDRILDVFPVHDGEILGVLFRVGFTAGSRKDSDAPADSVLPFRAIRR